MSGSGKKVTHALRSDMVTKYSALASLISVTKLAKGLVVPYRWGGAQPGIALGGGASSQTARSPRNSYSYDWTGVHCRLHSSVAFFADHMEKAGRWC